MIEKILQKDKNLSQETARHWAEISCSAYEFDRREATAAVLKSIAKQQVVEFMDTFLVPGAPQRKAFCSQVRERDYLSVMCERDCLSFMQR